jgi:hypothetical protein
MKRGKATGWNRPLASPIKLRDGHVIETPDQALRMRDHIASAEIMAANAAGIAA